MSRDTKLVESNVRKLNIVFSTLKKELLKYLDIIKLGEKKISIHNHFKTALSNMTPNNANKFEVKYGAMFLVFNYTNTIELYRELFGTGCKIVNIHGSLKDSSNPVIFGYGDESTEYYSKIEDLNINEFLTNFKSFWYYKTSNYHNLSAFLDSNIYEVCIMGHSCGISDRVLLKRIFESEKCRNIRIFHYKRPEGDTDYTEKTYEISRHFRAELKDKMRISISPSSTI